MNICIAVKAVGKGGLFTISKTNTRPSPSCTPLPLNFIRYVLETDLNNQPQPLSSIHDNYSVAE